MSFRAAKRYKHDSSDECDEGIMEDNDQFSSTMLTKEEKDSLKRLGMTVHMIKTLSVRDFNDLVRGKSQVDSRVAKALRRKLKNRGYAADCRNKREDVLENLKSKKSVIEMKVKEEEQKNSDLAKLKNDLQRKCELMEAMLEKERPLTILSSGQILPEAF